MRLFSVFLITIVFPHPCGRFRHGSIGFPCQSILVYLALVLLLQTADLIYFHATLYEFCNNLALRCACFVFSLYKLYHLLITHTLSHYKRGRYTKLAK